jgi:hypothetical protein
MRASFNLGDIVTLPPSGSQPSVPTFYHPAVVPDSMLPATLKRRSPYLPAETARLFSPNAWDNVIWREAALWSWIRNHGGLKTCCRIPELGAPVYSIAPFDAMPSNGIPQRQIFNQPLSAFQSGGLFTGTDVVVGSWQIPKGYDGAITHFLAFFTGDGFDDGLGNIVWRLMIGQRYAKNLGNVQFTFGSLDNALLVPGQSIRCISGQTVSLIANVPVSSPISGGNVFAGTLGWTYPRR